MTDTAAAAPATPGLLELLERRLGVLVGFRDMALALAVLATLAVLILPLPRWLLDISLAVSITLSVLILLTALFVEKPLEFNAFPTILLLATMIRLALNLATTRLILTHGHEGPSAAGHVIEAFGGFVMGGDFLIGIIVFAILIIVNFVVITKGSGRIAEVSARFTLDAMPGKQMAIDADLSAGLITEDEARKRRRELEEESGFFGAMDGAGKFVRGDAIAGLLITVINILAGIIIGVGQKDMSLLAAAENFTRLTVGDGLVSQIPALLTSTAAGIIVTKASVSGSTNNAVFGQLGRNPKVLGLSAGLLTVLALLPGVPAVPFLSLATAIGGLGWFLRKQALKTAAEAAAKVVRNDEAPAEEPISTALKMDEIRLELGYALLPLVGGNVNGAKLTDQIKALRRQLAGEFGFVLPSVRIQDNVQLQPEGYVIRIREVQAGRGEIRAGMLLIMDPRGDTILLSGEKTREPTFGLPAMWVDPQHREDALLRGYTVVEPSTVVTTHLTEVIKDNMADMLSYVETRKLLDELDKTHQKLIGDLIPAQITYTGVQKVLQNLLAERISIRDLSTILEGIAESCASTRSLIQITEHVRSRLARQITDMNVDEQGCVPFLALSAEWEQEMSAALVGNGDDRQLALPPSRLHVFIAAVRREFEQQALAGVTPVLLTGPLLRPLVRSIIERFRPLTAVISHAEIHPRARIRSVGQISGGQVSGGQVSGGQQQGG
ncbi:MAG: flagellar biosynthesis protein FlhA [Defluviicoccus sp.]|nr:flagellar biosynthesis protein FlhA [Defluviicoccus sp.]MDG4591398.1 flagellar biosynthesis protein FlhA [Defluviicoccus sp.]MDS4073514.1 flagellar biosynthesis protein FlhA [Defluviicoccus sp.]